MRARWFLAALLLSYGGSGEAQTRTIRPGDMPQDGGVRGAPLSAIQEITATLSARLGQMGNSDPTEGKLTLLVVADYEPPGSPKWMQPPERIAIRIPLASTEEAYGESRECSVSKEGVRGFVYTAGLDEGNFVAFAATAKPRSFRFLLNKYICRALAAAYTCKSGNFAPVEAKPSRNMRYWRVGTYTAVQLESKDAGVQAEITPVTLSSTGKPFDYAQCEKIAPSDGLCCVAGKTTEWHCGGTPTGEGWHQVSGSCFHRETGGSCQE